MRICQHALNQALLRELPECLKSTLLLSLYSPLVKQTKPPFKWRHFDPALILLCVRWYCYQLSYRDAEELTRERGLEVDHSTLFRWVRRYALDIDKPIRQHLKTSGTSYRMDETYIKVRKIFKYLAVDKEGNTIEFMLSAERDVSAAKTVL